MVSVNLKSLQEGVECVTNDRPLFHVFIQQTHIARLTSLCAQCQKYREEIRGERHVCTLELLMVLGEGEGIRHGYN